MGNNRATEIPEHAVKALDTIRRHSARVHVDPRVDAKLYTAFGYVWLTLDSADWLDSLMWLLDECERDGATVRAITVWVDNLRLWQWAAPGWSIRADQKRAAEIDPRDPFIQAVAATELREAVGVVLDAFGEMVGIRRVRGPVGSGSDILEDDASYRGRILARMRADNRFGTAEHDAPAGALTEVSVGYEEKDETTPVRTFVGPHGFAGAPRRFRLP